MSRKGYTIYQRRGTGPWYVSWTDGTGKRRAQRASTIRSVAHEVGRAKAAEADRVRTGVVDPAEAKAKQAGRLPLAGHLKAWARSLRTKGNTEGHVRRSERRAEQLLALAGCTSLAEVAGEHVQTALGKLATEGTPQTARHYLTALRNFVRWCLRTDRLAIDPLRSVAPPNVAGKAFTRRPFTDAELAKLLTATAARATRCPVGGRDRAMYYLLMAYTGLRAGEAMSLTPSSFDFGGSPARLTVEAAYSKRRRRDPLLLRDDLAEQIKPWLAGRPSGQRLFAWGRHSNLHRVFVEDAKAAGIVAASKKEVVGMHSLRRFFITRAVRSGGLAVAQDLARHSTPALTKEYADLTVEDHLQGLAGLPKLCSAPDSAPNPAYTGNGRKMREVQ